VLRGSNRLVPTYPASSSPLPRDHFVALEADLDLDDIHGWAVVSECPAEDDVARHVEDLGDIFGAEVGLVWRQLCAHGGSPSRNASYVGYCFNLVRLHTFTQERYQERIATSKNGLAAAGNSPANNLAYWISLGTKSSSLERHLVWK
jgi:hypothetical protein